MKRNYDTSISDDDDQQSAIGDSPAPALPAGEIIERLQRIEAAVELLVQQKTIKDWYTTEEVAALVGKAPFTVREWCRLGRVNADKRDCGRGNAKEWVIPHEELVRIRNQGLLPSPGYRHVR